jgi:hypothetical protein
MIACGFPIAKEIVDPEKRKSGTLVTSKKAGHLVGDALAL